MNQKQTLFVMIAVMMTLLTGCAMPPTIAQVNAALLESDGVVTGENAPNQTSSLTPSCAQPTPEIAAHCAAMEQAILATTVRLEFYRWREGNADQPRELIESGISHATVKDGRYLVTHNHFYIDLYQPQNQENIRFSIYRADGELLVKDMPLTVFSVVVADSETLLLDFQEYAGEGFFEVIGMPSAIFQTGTATHLQPGIEVAQVDWDGVITRVDWVQVERLADSDGTAQIDLADLVTPGASGGGIFWQGVHIANNWQLVSEYHQGTDRLYRQYSVAALDSWSVLTAVTFEAAIPNLH